MFEKFIADVNAKSTPEVADIRINPELLVIDMKAIMGKLNNIEAMSEKETYEILKEHHDKILAHIFDCSNKDFRFLLTSPKFLSILTQVANETQFGYDEIVHCNKLIYEFIMYVDNQDNYIRNLMFMLGEVVNKVNVRRLLGCDLNQEFAIFLAVTHKSSFNEKLNINRLNFT